MGTYSKSNFGKISGKVGEGVGSRWRGIKYLRSLPTKSGKPATVSQLAVYAKFALSAARLSPIKDILYIGFSDKKLNTITGYNAAVKLFITNAILGEYPDYTVDYSKMQLSKGSLRHLSHLTLDYSGGLLRLEWTVRQGDRSSFADDKVMVVVYNETTNLYTVDENIMRSDNGANIDIDAESGDTVHVWAFCIKRDGITISTSQYIGTVTLPL